MNGPPEVIKDSASALLCLFGEENSDKYDNWQKNRRLL